MKLEENEEIDKIKLQKNIKNELINLSEEKYKEFHSKLCNTKYEILGVRLPLIRNIAKRLVKEGIWKEYILNSSNEVYEEIMLQALTIGYAKMDIETTIKYIEIVLPKIDNWAICDSMCNNLKITQKHKKEMWDYILEKLKSEDEYIVRFCYVMMLNYYIDTQYIQEIFEIIDSNKRREYYIQMAIAWLISCIYINLKNETISYLRKSNLDKFTYNKSIQKIVESYRVTTKDKEEIKKLRK